MKWINTSVTNKKDTGISLEEMLHIPFFILDTVDFEFHSISLFNFMTVELRFFLLIPLPVVMPSQIPFNTSPSSVVTKLGSDQLLSF
jgi:hypothetical protein